MGMAGGDKKSAKVFPNVCDYQSANVGNFVCDKKSWLLVNQLENLDAFAKRGKMWLFL